MRKKTFLNYKKTEILCRVCNRTLPVDNFHYNSIKNDDTGVCKGCSWIKNNQEKIKSLNYDIQLITDVIHFVFENNPCILNNISKSFNLNIDDTIKLIKKLKIGNKKLLVATSCEFCKKPLYLVPSAYVASKDNYCSSECYWKDKKAKTPKGKENKFYNRVHTKCTNCGKEMDIIPFDYNKTNRFGDNHNFCCQQCYWDFRSKYYIDNKSNREFVKWTPDLINRIRINNVLRMSSMERLNTKPQIELNSILDNLNIKYKREYPVKYYSIDNYLTEYNLMIEVMGDYWHANPTRFNKNTYGLTKKQLEDIHRDKLKYSYIKNHYNIEILYLWETDILLHKDVCQELIQKYINNNGDLTNYNSFNYSIENNSLVLNKNIVVAYKDRELSEYKSLLRNKVS